MIRLSKAEKNKLDLSDACILIVSQQVTEQGILANILHGFGAAEVRRATPEQTLNLIKTELFDLIVVDAASRDSQLDGILKSIRAQPDLSRRQTAIIVVRGHVRKTEVFHARDAGANLVLTKPVSPQIMFDHLRWLAEDHRPFLESDNYVGPDRRFNPVGPPLGTAGRRHTDRADAGVSEDADLPHSGEDRSAAKKANV